MRTFNLSTAIANLRYYSEIFRLMTGSAILLFFIVLIVYSTDKKVEPIGVGVVTGCPAVKNNFFLGEIHRATVTIQDQVIENVRLINCVKTKKVSVIKKHKHWGFKGHYAASYTSKQ